MHGAPSGYEPDIAAVCTLAMVHLREIPANLRARAGGSIGGRGISLPEFDDSTNVVGQLTGRRDVVAPR